MTLNHVKQGRKSLPIFLFLFDLLLLNAKISRAYNERTRKRYQKSALV